jgi:hypothetical protein
MTTEAVRVPPHSVDAEQGVIGGLLLDNRAWDRLGDLLSAEDFYRHERQRDRVPEAAADGPRERFRGLADLEPGTGWKPDRPAFRQEPAAEL